MLHQVLVVDGLEDNLDVALEKPRLNEVVSLQAEGLALARVDLTVVAVLHAGSLGQENCVGKMLPRLKTNVSRNKVARIIMLWFQSHQRHNCWAQNLHHS